MRLTPIITPGRWIIQADPDWAGKHPYHDCRYITSNHKFEQTGEELWTLDHFDAEIICEMRDGAHQKANAHLIAAAPDLLAACKSALAIMPAGGNVRVCGELLNAIAKAESGL